MVLQFGKTQLLFGLFARHELAHLQVVQAGGLVVGQRVLPTFRSAIESPPHVLELAIKLAESFRRVWPDGAGRQFGEVF